MRRPKKFGIIFLLALTLLRVFWPWVPCSRSWGKLARSCNDWCIKIGTNLSTVSLLCLVRFLMHQTLSTNGEQNFHGLLITYELYILVARRTAFGSVFKVEDYWKCFKEHFTYICSQRLQGISKYFLQFYSKCTSEGCKTIHNCCILMRWLGTSEATTVTHWYNLDFKIWQNETQYKFSIVLP